MSDEIPSGGDRRTRELLLSDLEHFGESLWRNEEIGEKRLNYFVTLITAAAAGLVALHTDGGSSSLPLFRIRNGTLAVLVVFGLVTYFRMLRRNQVTDQYQKTLNYIRRRLRGASAFDYEVPMEAPRRWHSFFRGGLADTAAAVTASLTCALLISLGGEPSYSIAAGSVLLLVLVVAARRPDRGNSTAPAES